MKAYKRMTKKERAELCEALAQRPQAADRRPEWIGRLLVDRLYRFDGALDPDVAAIWRAAKDPEDLARRVVADQKLSLSQLAAVINGGDWYWKRGMLGDRCRHSSSDAGSLKIGVDGFAVMVPNGRGDGVTRWAVLKDGEFNDSAFKYFTVVESSLPIRVYAYDCGNQVQEELPAGCYGLYYSDGLVVIEKVNEAQ